MSPIENITACPVCQQSEFVPYQSCKDNTVSGEVFNIVTCQSCGFHFTNPRPSEASIGRYYQSENYISHSNTKKGLMDKIYHLVRNFTLKGKLTLINKQQPNKGKLLDIGCGTGMFLKVCQDNGWNVTGIEPDKGASQLANEQGLNVIKPTIWQLNQTEQYEVITMWHVLEHVHQLQQCVEWLRNHLTTNGTLIIAVPNLNAYDAQQYQEQWAAFDVPRHLYHFSQQDMKRLFESKGFHIQKILPMYFDSFYVSMLSSKYKNGKIGYWESFINGLASNWKARSSSEYSSLIYVIKHQ